MHFTLAQSHRCGHRCSGDLPRKLPRHRPVAERSPHEAPGFSRSLASLVLMPPRRPGDPIPDGIPAAEAHRPWRCFSQLHKGVDCRDANCAVLIPGFPLTHRTDSADSSPGQTRCAKVTSLDLPRLRRHGKLCVPEAARMSLPTRQRQSRYEPSGRKPWGDALAPCCSCSPSTDLNRPVVQGLPVGCLCVVIGTKPTKR